jgi:hypothetical protein
VFEVQLACVTDNHLTDKHKPETYTFIALLYLWLLYKFGIMHMIIFSHGFPFVHRARAGFTEVACKNLARRVTEYYPLLVAHMWGCSLGTADVQDHHRPILKLLDRIQISSAVSFFDVHRLN